jgi:PAS domain-containing protein
MLLYSIGLELTILVGSWLCLRVWQGGRSAPARATFVALVLSGIFWCVGELVLHRGICDEVTSDRIRYVGILSLAPLWAGLAGHTTRLELARHVPWFPLALLAPMACLYALLFSERWSGLFMTTVPDAIDLYGPLWWVSAGYSYLMVLLGSGLFIASALRSRVPGRWLRHLAVGLSPLVPLAGNAAYVASGLSWPVDPTPLLFVVTLLALRSAILTGGLLQVLPVSHHDLIEQLPLGIILTDRKGVVIDVNPAAERRLGFTEARVIGRTLDAILTEAASDVRADVSPILSQGREAGQMVLIDPPAKGR